MSNQDTPIEASAQPTSVDTTPITSDDLRRTDAAFARTLENHSSDLDVLTWGHSRGFLPRTLQSWGMAVVDPKIASVGYGKEFEVKPDHVGHLVAAGLLVGRRRTKFEPPKLTGTSKHDQDADTKDRRPELAYSGPLGQPFRQDLGGRSGPLGRSERSDGLGRVAWRSVWR